VTVAPAPVGEARLFRYDAHPRTDGRRHYVYAVLSRRARGVSIGLNLNPDAACNFGCVYCQVDRSEPRPPGEVDERRLLEELEATLEEGRDGRLLARAAADGVPVPLRRVADVAFSGDGEPTSYPRWGGLVDDAGEVIDRVLPGTPIVLITNASLFHRPEVAAGLDRLAARGGRVWAKLDAGTESWFSRVNGTRVPFARVLDNIGEEACKRPLVIQSLFLRLAGEAPPPGEIDAWVSRLADLVAGGGRLREVQVTTIARRPADPAAEALSPAELEEIAGRARAALPLVPVEVYGASTTGNGRTGHPHAPDGGAR
jgi:pyruvate-formate lyase-activating enzyme